jgi:predicted NBD/HSP70 family sugar kinase/biotin operon repressor
VSFAFQDLAGDDQTSPRHRALAELLAAGSLSRAQLARATGLAPSTMTALIRSLREEGLVVEVGPVENHGDVRRRSGPRGTALTINPDRVAAVGVDYGFRNVRVVVCDLFARVLALREARLSEGYSRSEGLDTGASLVREAVEASGVTHRAIVGAGVALPGPIDTLEQRVVQSEILAGWGGTTAGDFSRVFRLPALIENDANLAALGEHIWGAARGRATTITVKFHSGIGAGLIANHQLVTGAHGGAGEIGHTTVDPRGTVCRCGKRGCLDTIASVPAILAALQQRHEGISVRALLDLLAEGDPGAHRVVADAAALVGQAVGAACLLAAPDTVVVVGAMARAGEAALAPIRTAVEQAAIPQVANIPNVTRGALGDKHTALGAVALALRHSGWLPVRSARATSELPAATRDKQIANF